MWTLAGGLLLAAAPLLWGLSYLRGDTLLWLRGGGNSVMVNHSAGRIGLWLFDAPVTEGTPPAWLHLPGGAYAESAINFGPEAGYDVTGPSWLHWYKYTFGEGILGVGGFFVTFPHWLLCIPTAAALLRATVLASRRRRRRRRGWCVACGYDLRSSPGRCPECGEPATHVP
jgi:hypothetical protein